MAVVDDDDRLLLGHAAALGGGPLVDARRVRRGGGVARARGAPRGARGDGRRRRRRVVPREPAVAVPGLAHARLPRDRGATDVTVDGVELAEARWFTRDELAAAVRSARSSRRAGRRSRGPSSRSGSAARSEARRSAVRRARGQDRRARDLRERRVRRGGPVGEHDRRDGLVAAVERLDERRGVGVLLDVDLGVADARGVQLRLEPAAVAAPGRGVHRDGAGVGQGLRGHRSSSLVGTWGEIVAHDVNVREPRSLPGSHGRVTVPAERARRAQGGTGVGAGCETGRDVRRRPPRRARPRAARRRDRAARARAACSRAPARARPGRSRTASPTASRSARTGRATCSR